MSYVIVGLGNPGEEYTNTRHNAGRILISHLADLLDSSLILDKKSDALLAKAKIGKNSVLLLSPNTFMNKSGSSVKSFVSSVKSAEKLVVIYDDLDLPFGHNKVSFNKSSGGHKGVESIIKSIKTQKFVRVRVGISPKTPSGKIKKPIGEDAVMKIIMGDFKKEELVYLKKLSKIILEGLELFVSKGVERFMTDFNSR